MMKALITGASSGIGRDMARYLASMGYDLFLVGRDKKKLNSLLDELNVKVRVIEMDLSNYKNCFKLHDMLCEDKIDLVINNAGFGDYGLFYETDINKELDMIELNVKAYHILTKLFLKDFVKKGNGRILNVASFAGFVAGPYMSTYYATKAYVLNLSLGIYEELKKEKSNVKISVFCPGPVDTNFNNVANVKFGIKSISSEFASRYAIDNCFKNKTIIVPPNMKLMRIFSKFIPTKIMLSIISNNQVSK